MAEQEFDEEAKPPVLDQMSPSKLNSQFLPKIPLALSAKEAASTSSPSSSPKDSSKSVLFKRLIKVGKVFDVEKKRSSPKHSV